MADATGNVLKVPGYTQGPSVGDDEILGSYVRFTQKGLTLLKTTGRVYQAGTLLKASATPKKYDGATAATDTIVGILRKPVDVGTEDKLGNYVASGAVKLSKLKWANGTAVASTDYAAIATALNGRIDNIHGYLIF